MDILRDKQYNYALHFILEAQQPKTSISISFNRKETQLKTLTIEKLINSREKARGLSEIIKIHSLQEFNRIYSFDLGSRNEVLMFCSDEIENSEYFNVLVLIKNNPNLNLVIDNVVKKLRKINRFRNVNFSTAENELVSIYYVEIIDGKFKFNTNECTQSKVDVVRKGEHVSVNKIFKTGILLTFLILTYFLITKSSENKIITPILVAVWIILIEMAIEKLIRDTSVLCREGKDNGSYFVLNTNYSFEDELKNEIKYDLNISSGELQTPKEE